MLTFFRKLRKSLIEPGSTRKYLLYAIGEILLVMIGILLALQVNNWNQNRRDNNVANEYLIRIKADLLKDTTLFRNRITSNLALRERIKETLVVIYDGIENREQVTQAMEVYDSGLNQVFVSNNNTYTDLISTGNLRLIKNIELKDLVANLYSQYDEKRKLMEPDKAWMDGIGIHMDSNVDFLKFSKETIDIFTRPEMLPDKEWSFLKNRESIGFRIVVRAISATAWSAYTSNGYYDELLSSCHEVIEAINEELPNPINYTFNPC